MKKGSRDVDNNKDSKALPEVFPAKRGRPAGSGRKKVHKQTCTVLQIPAQNAKDVQKTLLPRAKVNSCLGAQVGAALTAAEADASNQVSHGKARLATDASKTSKADSKPGRKRSKKVKSSHKHLRQFMQAVVVDGETFRMGDSAYLILTNDFDEDEFAEEEACQVCGSAEQEGILMVECDKCLLGYHLTCLKPPLAEVPKVSGCTTFA